MGQDEQDLVSVGQVIRDWMEAQRQSKEIPRYTRTHMKELVRLWDQVVGDSIGIRPTPRKSNVRDTANDGVERRRAQAALRRSEERFRIALANSSVVVCTQDRELKYTWISGAAVAWMKPQRCLGHNDSEIFPGEDGACLTAIKQSVLESGEPLRSEISVTLYGDKRHFDLTVEPLRDSRGAITGVGCAAVEITALKLAVAEREELIAELQKALEKNAYLATHDALTGAPNRRLLEDRLDQALARAHRQESRGAVLALDLDGFKTVNDSFGHRVGDLVLTNVVARIRGRVRASDTLARTGGDEFTVLAEGANREGAKVLAWSLQTAFAEPFEVGGKVVSLGVSIGVALYPDDGTTADEVLTAADKSMYAAKNITKGRRQSIKVG
jgi:diguanylate cyclase (GGDEF)-like protein/PAS domain S-box-containing protein